MKGEGMVRSEQWRGCYDGGWTELIVPEAFAHPAKYARGLIARIYQHCVAEGWVKPGDVVLDPFGGVALGALDAMRLGLNWVGCELEAKFVALGGQNIALWQSRYGHVPRYGTARLLQGDSRKLATLVSTADASVSSPPFLEVRNASPRKESARQQKMLADLGVGGATDGRLEAYGDSPGQLGAMREGSFDAAVSNPPYKQHVAGLHNGIDFSKLSDGGKRRTASRDRLGTGFGDSPGQLGRMAAGGFEAAISSPPYSDTMSDPHDGIKWRQAKTEGGSENHQKRGQSICGEYGRTPGQLGQLREGEFAAAVSSPPYEGCLEGRNGSSHHVSGAAVQRARAGRKCQSMNYEGEAANVGNQTGDDFWHAAREIVEQVYAVLRPGGHAVWVTKDYVRAKQRVPFSDNWQQLCEVVGFRHVCSHRALFVVDNGQQQDAFGKHKTLKRERKSFFRRLAEAKGSPRIDWEDVRCFVKG